MSTPIACVVVELEPPCEWEAERLLSALDAFSDRVEDAALGVAYIGLDGLAAMHGGERPMLDALAESVAAWRPRIGVGAGKFAAEVAARTLRSPGLRCVGPGRDEATAFLQPHSIDYLPCSDELLGDLHRLCLHRLGDVAAQDANALLDRFGHEGRRAWELASGIDERPLVPRLPVERVTETLALAEPSISLELLRVAIEMLLMRAFAQPQMQGREAGSATLACQLEDASSWSREFHFRKGIGNWRRAAEIIQPTLESEHPQSPIESLTVTLGQLSGATGRQLSLFPDLRADRERRLLETERRLQARLGDAALHRLVPVAPWHPAPEQRTVQVSIDPAAGDELREVARPRPIAVREGSEHEPVAVRVGEQWHAISEIEAEWRFNLWWRPTPVERQYYQVSERDGRRLTLYRDGRDAHWYRQSA